jgi:membrane-associated phospholipid phosphatase
MSKHQSAQIKNEKPDGTPDAIQGHELIQSHAETEVRRESALNRRDFLGRAATFGALAAGLLALPNWLGKGGILSGQTVPVPNCAGCELVPLSGTGRADKAYEIRVKAASYERYMPIPTHPCNGDEALYQSRNYFASYTKGLKRAAGTDGTVFGEVDPVEYCKLLKALASGDPAKFEEVLLGFSNSCSDVTLSDESTSLTPSALEPNKQRRLESPQAGLNFDLEGKDYYQLINRPSPSLTPVAFPPAYTFSSLDEAVEIIENYWQALTRDVAFIDYASSSLVAKASADLTNFASAYHGPLAGGAVTPGVYSRGILPGDTKGAFLSQFFLRDIPYGAQTIPAKIRTPVASHVNDFMTTQPEWRMIQTGQTPNRQTAYDTMRFIRSGRDLAEYVHNDAIYQAYLNAALILMTPASMGGLGVPINPNNPYNQRTGGYCKQLNFVEFGPSQLLSLLGEVSVRAHKAVWYQKWQVHRRLRPEEFAARAAFTIDGHRDYPVHGKLFNSNVFEFLKATFDSYFLPQAFPEGSPTHPAYGAGHATLAGACVTILKAWFDSERQYGDFAPFYQPTADGTSLVPVPFSSDISITVADELNKLASNVAIGRNIGGVHWRSDYTESVFLGEQVAIWLLEDYGFTYNEKFAGFQFRNFAGNLVTIGGTK